MTLYDPSFKSRAVLSDPLHDPFDRSHLTPSHIVTPIAPMHTLILNKYYTISEHSILITNSFEKQESLLTYDDLQAWFFCISSIKALGFYNSNSFAGASQPHKHMQLVPLDEIRRLSPSATYTLPIDSAIRSKIIRREWKYFLPFAVTNGRVISNNQFESGGSDADATLSDELQGASRDSVYHLPEYHFKHAIVALISSEEWGDISTDISYDEYLVASYRHLLLELHLIASLASKTRVAAGAYNLLLTERWMLIVSRRQEAFYESTSSGSSGDTSIGGDTEEVVASVNGLGFAGLLLARSPLALSIIRDKTPLAVLEGVSVAVSVES
jgi:ATP adenylyltransferase